MKLIENLTDKSRVRVPGVIGECFICTLSAYLMKNVAPEDATRETEAALIERQKGYDKEAGRETAFAWVMQAASVLSGNYPGKAEELAKTRREIEAAPVVETGDLLEIDGQTYVARVAGNYSDPVHLTPYEIPAEHKGMTAAQSLSLSNIESALSEWRVPAMGENRKTGNARRVLACYADLIKYHGHACALTECELLAVDAAKGWAK